jgi:ABC-type multidrug transport system fused ATPase/permease subunit
MVLMNTGHNKNIATIWGLLDLGQKKSAKLFILMSIVATFFEMLSMGMIIPLLYTFTSTDQSHATGILVYILNIPWMKNLSIYHMLGLMVIFFAMKNIFLFFLGRFQARFVFEVEETLSNKVYKVYLRQTYPFFLKNNSAQLIRNVMREPSQFAHNALSPLCLLITELFIFSGVISLLIMINPLGAICSFIFFGSIGYIFYSIVHQRIAKWGRDHQFHEGKRLQNLQEGFGSIKEILISSLQHKFASVYAIHMNAGVVAGVNQQSIQAAPRLFIEIFAVVVLAGVVSFFSESEPVALLPIIGLYAAAAFRLMPGVNRIINALQSLRYSESSVQLLAKELDQKNILFFETKGRQVIFNRCIELKNFSFKYESGNDYLFKNANLTIKKGEAVFLSGPSGVGKSTLVDLICGLQQPTSGELLIDGIEIKACTNDWQKHIAYVPQTTFILDETIKQNIVFGGLNQDIDEKRLYEVCRVVRLDEVISRLPQGIETRVGERGGGLSGGQRQRIGIARALYKGGNLLILDEATNALDAELKAEVVQNILDFTEGVTKIWITHDIDLMCNVKKMVIKNKLIEIT